MQAAAARALVSAKWLAAAVVGGSGGTGSAAAQPLLRVLDASWYLPRMNRNARQEFKQRHIPGALFFDLDECSDRTSPFDHMLPSSEQFAEYASELGISRHTHVVVYDGSDFGSFSAPRVWWMFRVFGHRDVSVLDGGLRHWLREGYPVTAEGVRPLPAEYEAILNGAWVKNFEEVEQNLETKQFQVVDARPEGRFKGIEPEPRPGIEPGHIPGSVNMPFYSFLTESGTIKSEQELGNLFKEKNVDLSKPLVAACGSGVTACQIALAAFLCGKEDTMIFDGSWCEWFIRGKPEEILSMGKGKSL